MAAVKVGQGSTPPRVRLSWPTTKRLDNHAPEFRPTHSDRMYGRERTLARQAEDAFAAIDRRTLEAYLAGEIRWEEFLQNYMAAFAWFQEALTYTLHEQFAESAKDEEARIRKAINKDLARLGSPVRVVEPETVAKQVYADMPWGISPDEFNQVNGASVRWAQNESGGLITNMAAEQRTAVQEAIGRAHTAAQTWSTGRTTLGMTRRQTSQALMSILMEVDPTTPAAARLAKIYGVHAPGLTPGWERATMNFADRQADGIYQRIGTGLSPGKAQDMVAARTTRYANKLRRARSRMIARTEIMRASNQGQLYAMTKAVNDGLISPMSAGKMWMTGPIDVCPVCEGLQGQVIPLNESFALVGDAPPAHPNCRCIISLIPNISKAPVPRGIGNQSFPPGHAQNPMVWDFSGGASTVPRMALSPAPPSAPLVPPGPPPVPGAPPVPTPTAPSAPSAPPRRMGRPMAGEVMYTPTAKTARVVDPVIKQIDEVMSAPKPYSSGPTSITLRATGAEGEAGFFTPNRKLKFPTEPRPPRVRSSFATQAEYDDAIAKYQEAYERYRVRIAEGRASNWQRSQVEVVGKGTRADVGGMQNTVGHEWGHRLDYVEDIVVPDPALPAGRMARSKFRSRMETAQAEIESGQTIGGFAPRIAPTISGEYIAETAFLETAVQSEAIETLVRLTSKIDVGWTEYATSPTELWARAYSQWLATRHGTAEMAAAMTTEAAKVATTTLTDLTTQWHGVQWRAAEFDEKIAPLVEAVLRSWGYLT